MQNIHFQANEFNEKFSNSLRITKLYKNIYAAVASHGWLPATKATSFSIDQNNILTNKFKSLYLNRKKFSAYSMKWKEYKFASWFKILNFWQWHFLFRAYIRRSINISLHYFITAFNYLEQTNTSTHFHYQNIHH